MSESMPDLPMSDDLHRAVEELIDAALVRDADPHRHRVAVKWMEAEEKVDRLARALAADRMTVHTWKHKSRCWAMCESCRATLAEQNELGADTEAKAKRALEHRPDCVYIEAIEQVAALEDQ